MSLSARNVGTISDSSYGDDGVCPKCQQPFDTDADLLESHDSRKHKLPFTCSKCFDFTLCGACLDSVDWASFECSVCHKKQGFDRDDPVPNRRLCALLRKRHGDPPVAASSNGVASSTLVTPNANRVPKPEPTDNAKTSSASRRTKRVAQTPTDISSSSIKTEPAKSGARKHQSNNAAKKTPPKSRKKIAYKVGDRVYCRWPDNDLYYWGKIANVHNRRNKATSYKIEFDDGGIRNDVDESEFVSETHYVELECDDEAHPKKKKAKLSTSRRDEAAPRTACGKRTPKTTSGVKEEDRKPAAVSSGAVSTGCNDSSVDDDEKEAFMQAPLFHLNSFIYAKRRHNVGFGPFIREQVATPGFAPVSQHAVDMCNQDGSYEEIRDEIKRRTGDASAASQVALWLTQANVGAYVVMRHEYKHCPWVPGRLKDAQGKYIGPVLVLGRVTEVIVPRSNEERFIAASLNFPECELSGNTFCRVRFDRMIIKNDLDRKTQNYINQVCQRTLTSICVEGKMWGKLGTDARTVREDLWNNANIRISGHDFEDTRNFTY